MVVWPDRLFGPVLAMVVLPVSRLRDRIHRVVVREEEYTLSLFASPKGDRRYDGAAMTRSCVDNENADRPSVRKVWLLDKRNHRAAVSHARKILAHAAFPLPKSRVHTVFGTTNHINIHDFTESRLQPIGSTMAAVTDQSRQQVEELNVYQRATEAASFIRSKVPDQLQSPRVAIVCGSGLGGIADTIRQDGRAEISYSDIPHFPQPTGRNLLHHWLIRS